MRHRVNNVTGTRAATYAYDANGNMTCRLGSAGTACTGGDAITWTSFNKPAQINKGANYDQFTYGPDQSRFKRVSKLGSNTTTIRYVAGLYEKADSGGVTTHRHFIYADGKTIAVHERYSNANPDTTNYLHRDYQGSVDVITNSSGTELERFSYDAFGKRRFDDWTADASDGLYGYRHLSDRAYTGHESLDSTLLTHMNGRVQDPVLGRMISADPTIPYPLSSQSYNRYSYAQNNPMSRVDPSGFGDLKQTECGDVKCFPPIETIGEREEDPFHEMTRDQFVDALRQEIRDAIREAHSAGYTGIEVYYNGEKLGQFDEIDQDDESDWHSDSFDDGAEAMAENAATPGFQSATGWNGKSALGLWSRGFFSGRRSTGFGTRSLLSAEELSNPGFAYVASRELVYGDDLDEAAGVYIAIASGIGGSVPLVTRGGAAFWSATAAYRANIALNWKLLLFRSVQLTADHNVFYHQHILWNSIPRAIQPVGGVISPTYYLPVVCKVKC